MFVGGALPSLLRTVNFGTGADVEGNLKVLRKYQPSGPLFVTEFWYRVSCYACRVPCAVCRVSCAVCRVSCVVCRVVRVVRVRVVRLCVSFVCVSCDCALMVGITLKGTGGLTTGARSTTRRRPRSR
jgi:hypothetical protein